MGVKLGAQFPTTEIGSDPRAITTFAQTIEALGFHQMSAWDHVLGVDRNRPGGFTGPHDSTEAMHEPFVLFAYLAAQTTTLQFLTAVLILPQRPTGLVAKQAAELDVLSGGGRLVLGVGLGWNPSEYRALGQDFSRRGRRFEEQIPLMRRLWAEDTFDFTGRFDRIPHAGINPRPVHGDIPLWFGGMSDQMYDRVARMGDGWLPQTGDPEVLRAGIARISEGASAAGRDPARISYSASVSARNGVQQAAERAAAFVEAGATHVQVTTQHMGFTSVDQHLETLAAVKEQLAGVATA